MKLRLILLLVAFAYGRNADRTAALKRSNQALLKALKALTSEENAVGENQDRYHTSEWVSDNEGKGVYNTFWRDSRAMYGMECRGRKCDDKRLYYKANLKVKSMTWDLFQQDNPISEERGRNNFNCASGEVLNGIWCKGSYCDNIIPMCSKPKNFEIVGGRTETKWISEERDKYIGYCPDNYVIIGLKCKGGNCDNIKLKCGEYQITGGCPAGRAGGIQNQEGRKDHHDGVDSDSHCQSACNSRSDCKYWMRYGAKCYTYSGGTVDEDTNWALKHRYGRKCTSGTYYTLSQGSNCPNGKAITDKTECEQAVTAENAMQGNRPGRNLYSGNWGHVPYGCSVQSGGDWTIHLNSRKSGRNTDTYPSGIYTPVCKREWN